MSRKQILLIVAVAGVLGGYGMVRLWSGAAPVPAASPGATTPAVAGTAPENRLPSLLEGGGSSISVVGGMSREEMVRRGILRAETSAPLPTAAPGAALPAPPRGAAGTQLAPGQREGPPSALNFSAEVQAESRRFQCLCGCGHTLDVCPCNDQPVGAMTMLTYLENLMNRGQDKAGLDEQMVDRYGPRVLVQPE
jgi:hypothetical protein